jgi:hypothetical protein
MSPPPYFSVPSARVPTLFAAICVPPRAGAARGGLTTDILHATVSLSATVSADLTGLYPSPTPFANDINVPIDADRLARFDDPAPRKAIARRT